MVSRDELTFIAETYLASCFAQHTSAQVQELASRLALRHDQLSKLFATVVGEQPQHYLKRRQLAHAKDLLRRSDLPIVAIAAESGFGTITTFYRAFRRMTGTTPRAYRLHKM